MLYRPFRDTAELDLIDGNIELESFKSASEDCQEAHLDEPDVYGDLPDVTEDLLEELDLQDNDDIQQCWVELAVQLLGHDEAISLEDPDHLVKGIVMENMTGLPILDDILL
jgi:hypothetical protein